MTVREGRNRVSVLRVFVFCPLSLVLYPLFLDIIHLGNVSVLLPAKDKGRRTRDHIMHHVPVMPEEVLRLLAPGTGQIVVDATVGAGGHTRLLVEAVGPTGRVIGLDRDAGMLEQVKALGHGASLTLVHANFDRLRAVLDELGIHRVDAILADLGVCSDQLDDPRRGFSFQSEGPLDMRLDPGERTAARDLLRQLNERDLADLFWKYGEERFSRRIARKIVETRRREPLESTEQLAELVRRCVPRSRGQKIDPATRVFQALRIAVNEELGALERLLKQLPDCIVEGGRVALISFHSLEDRLVKHALRDRAIWHELTRKPLQAGEEEVGRNPRARSAKLRCAALREGLRTKD
jgi:16S rRNA (cytosine1402-N4)-methyltransferase